MVKCLGTLEDKYKFSVVEKILQKFNEKYPDVEADAYLGYPIYVEEYSNRRICVDLALMSKRGIFIVNILNAAVTDYGKIQDEIFMKVESKFKKQKMLLDKRKLCFDFYTITYSKEKMEIIDENPIAFSIDDFFGYVEDFMEAEDFKDDLYNKIISGIQEAYGINTHIERDNVKEGTKAHTIEKMKFLIERYDEAQMEAILSDTTGIQRIRGMAGSGKTVILARKAVELHTAHPDWNIVVTYSTRSLREQLVRLINKFYAAKNDGAKYDETKLKIMHSWGSANAEGVYYDICLRHGISPLNVSQAKAEFGKNVNYFSKMCEMVLKEVKQFNKMYDCILIDEAQDFDKSFLKLCLKVLDNNERLIYAYDELQKLNEESMPSPEDIFGKSINNDTPLTVCYRNQGRAIVTAHAIGMGLYRKDGLIQIPDVKVWEAIGYNHDGEIEEGKPAILYRTAKTSPELLDINKDEIINFITYNDKNDMNLSLLEMINNDIKEEQLLPGDIMIIDMDTYSYIDNCIILANSKFKNDEYNSFNIHTAGASNPEDFFREDSVVYSSVRRAKGNETYMIYIVNAQKCMTALTKRSDRNALFTAITRSKGWVKVMGYGEEMKELCEEFEKIKENDYRLVFNKYPTKEEQKQLIINNQDLAGKDASVFSNARELFDKLRKTGNISNQKLLQDFFGMTKEELIEMVEKMKEGE